MRRARVDKPNALRDSDDLDSVSNIQVVVNEDGTETLVLENSQTHDGDGQFLMQGGEHAHGKCQDEMIKKASLIQACMAIACPAVAPCWPRRKTDVTRWSKCWTTTRKTTQPWRSAQWRLPRPARRVLTGCAWIPCHRA